MYAVIRTGGKQERVAEGQTLRVELLGEDPGAEVRFTPLLLVDGETVLATPAQLAGSSVTATVVGEELGPEGPGLHLQEQVQPEHPVGSPPAVLDHRHHLDQPRRLVAERARGQGAASDVQDQRRRFDPQRPRLERPATRSEGLRRHGGAGRGHPGPPAGAPSSTPGSTWAWAATTRSSPCRTAPSTSPAARAASWSTSSPATDPGRPRRFRPRVQTVRSGPCRSRRRPLGPRPGPMARRRPAPSNSMGASTSVTSAATGPPTAVRPDGAACSGPTASTS